MPREIAKLLDDIVLLPGETLESVREFRRALARDLQPASSIEWILLCNFGDITRETRFYRDLRNSLLDAARREVVEQCLKDRPDQQHDLEFQFLGARQQSLDWQANPEKRKHIEQQIAKAGYTHGFVAAQGYERCAGEIETIERRLTELDARRFATLRELKSVNAIFAQKLRATSNQLLEN